jgi:HK97 gp10 family phage protein
MIRVFGIKEALARFAAMGGEARAASSITTTSSAAVVAAALKTRAPKKTGALAASIGVVDSEESPTSSTRVVGAQVPYDRFYQQGTSRQPARPYTEEVEQAAEATVRQIAETTFRAAIR